MCNLVFFDLWACAQLPGRRSPKSTDANQEANKLYQAGQYVEAIPKAKKVLKMYERALGLLEESMGPDRPYMLTVLENLAICYRSMGKENQAQKVKERARIIRSKM